MLQKSFGGDERNFLGPLMRTPEVDGVGAIVCYPR
jgi:hypothetical protein